MECKSRKSIIFLIHTMVSFKTIVMSAFLAATGLAAKIRAEPNCEEGIVEQAGAEEAPMRRVPSAPMAPMESRVLMVSRERAERRYVKVVRATATGARAAAAVRLTIGSLDMATCQSGTATSFVGTKT